MNSSGDSGVTMQHIFNKNIANTPTDNYTRAITSGELQDKLRNSLNEYSESNPEPPSMKD